MGELFYQFLEVLFIVGSLWFVWAPILLFFIFRATWYNYVHGAFLAGIKPVLLEITIPRDVAKSPKAMESIFAGIHGTMRNPDLIERYMKGIVTSWFSFEIVGDEAGVHFYIWTPEGFKRLLEAQIYAQYPSSEIHVVDDYTKALPVDIPNEEWNLWGTEFILAKPDAFPIRTYEDFVLEKISLKEEEQKIDPLSALIEFLGSFKPGERCWIQILVRPTGDGWKKDGEKIIQEMVGKKQPPKPNIAEKILNFIGLILSDLTRSGEAAPTGDKKEEINMTKITPGQMEVIKAVEANIAKIGFEIGFRWIYLGKNDVFNMTSVPAMMGIFKQFSSPVLNGFKPHPEITTKAGYIGYVGQMRRRIEGKKKERIYKAYRLRSFFYPPYNQVKPFVLSSSELATIYHFPGTVVGAPSMVRIEAKKGTPPPNLPL
jgi:hypothetical protein